MTKGNVFNDVFSITFKLLFMKEKMPEVETIMLFVKEEYEQSLEGVDDLNNMKEVCQKPPCTSVSKCLSWQNEVIQWDIVAL